MPPLPLNDVLFSSTSTRRRQTEGEVLLEGTETQSIITNPAVFSRTGRGIRPAGRDECFCECGCKMLFDRMSMISCNGGKRKLANTNCNKKLSRSCCPNWLCNQCDTLEWKDMKLPDKKKK